MSEKVISNWKQGSAPIVYGAYVCYIVYLNLRVINWISPVSKTIEIGILLAAGILAAAYFDLFCLRTFRSVPVKIVCLSASVLFLAVWATHGEYPATFWLPAALILMTAGKSFQRIAFRSFCAHCGVFICAMLGYACHLTLETVNTDPIKQTITGVGRSLGFVHPNSLALYVFLICLLGWYLWLKKRPGITFLYFWGIAVPVYYITRSRTALMGYALFPLMSLAGYLVSEKPPAYQKGAGRPAMQTIKTVLTAGIPFELFGITLLLSFNWKILWSVFHGTVMWNMASRFVQGGIAISQYGIRLTGSDIDLSGKVYLRIDEIKVKLYNLDNAYLGTLMEKGLLYLCALLLILTLVLLKCIREQNAPLLCVIIILLLLAMMETYPLKPFYNLAYFYLLADPGPEQVGRGQLVTVHRPANSALSLQAH